MFDIPKYEWKECRDKIVKSLYGGIGIDDHRVGKRIVENRSNKKDDDVIMCDKMEG
jgi:hypothetical protein